MNRIELHCHTSQVSPCGKISAEQVVDLYLKKGYQGIVITDHYSEDALRKKGILSGSGKVGHFLSGYRAAKEAAANRLTVLLGMELCLKESANDYLIYGMTEDFLRQNQDLMDLTITQLSQLVRENGMLLFQAHPFRNRMQIVNPCLLDGIEVYNGNLRHDSRNEMAAAWAKKFHLLQSSGSDFHQAEDLGRGGIVAPHPILNQEMLIRELKQSPQLIQTP
jgi:histidinol phosphatase-like PHP family hydrolase